MKHLFIHSLKSTLRTGLFKGGMAMKLVAGFIGFYFVLVATVLSLVMPDLVRSAASEGQSVVDVVAQYTVYYLFLDIVLRFLLQSLSGVKLQHYILLPVAYNHLIAFMLGRSLFNFFNLLTLIIIVPFAIRAVGNDLGVYAALIWLGGMLALMLGNSLLAIYLKLLFAGNLRATLVMVGMLVVAFATELTGSAILTISGWSEKIFSLIMSEPLSLLLFVYPALAYIVNRKYLLKNRYAEKEKISASKSGGVWSRLEWEGEGRISSLMSIELKMMLRHKRTRTLLLFSLVFLAYGFIFYQGEMWPPGTIFAGIFITGFAAINYGQFLGAWEGRFFDGIFSRNIPIEDYYHAKFRLLVLLLSVPYVLSLLYTLMDVKYFYLHTACFVFNVGFNAFILMFFSTYQRKALDLNAGSAFNYQGTSAIQFVVMIPLLVVPVLIFFMTDLLFGEMEGILAVAIAGLISLSFYQLWIKGISDNFREKKHAMSTGFRKKN